MYGSHTPAPTKTTTYATRTMRVGRAMRRYGTRTTPSENVALVRSGRVRSP
jgi:hypothetical protein